MNDFGTAFVTGAGGGIGRATAIRLAEAGAKVTISDRDEKTLGATARTLEEMGVDYTAVVGDITKDEDAIQLAAKAGPVRCLVNNAGIFDAVLFERLTTADFRRIFEVNVIAMFRLSQLVAETMPAGSAIVNIGSRAMLGNAAAAHYSASKAAVAGLTRSLALALAERDITVNAVAPGIIETDILRALSPKQMDALVAQQLGRKIGQPSDIADAVCYLASPDTRYVNGQVLFVDGGRSIGGSTIF